MNFLKLKAKNFLSYDKLEFEFKQGIHLVIGENRDDYIAESNGSGKSAIFEAIIYALFGKTFRCVKRKHSCGAGVSLEFELDGNKYKFIRYYNHTKYKNNLFIFVNEEQKIFRTREEQNLFIKKLIPISFKHFISSVIFVQGFPVKISTMSPSELKNFFLEFLAIDFDAILKQIKKDREHLKFNYKTKLSEFQYINSKLNVVKGKIDLIKTELNKIDIQDLEIKYKQVCDEINKLNKQIEELDKQITELSSKQVFINSQIDKFKKLLSNGKCPLCGSLISPENLSDHINELEDKLKILKEELYNLNLKKQELKSKEKELMEFKIELVGKIEQYKNQVKLLEEFESNYNMWEQKYIKLEQELNNLEYDLNLLEDFYSELLPSGSIRAFISKQFVDIYNKLLKNIVVNLYPELKDIKFIYKNNGVEIEGVNYKNLSGGEKRRLDFIFQLTFSELIYYIFGFKSDLLVFDEIFDNLDLQSSLAIIDFIKSYYGYDKKIYFITHNNDLKTVFDSVIKVIKENGTSKLDLSNYRSV